MVGNFSTRFSLSSFVKRVEKLSDDQRSAIKGTGFGHLLEWPNRTLSKNLLVELMERWSIEKNAFELPPGEIKITPMDVALILGLRVTGEPVVLKEDEPLSDLEKEYGATNLKRKITVASIEKRLQSLGGMVNEDFIRTFLLLTLGTFLFPNANGKVDSRYLSLLEHLDKVCQFAWGAAVLEDLFNWLSKRKEMNIRYVGGCLIFLQMWSYEHIDIARPSFPDCYLTFPRACRWENISSHHRHWFTSKFEELQENQINWQLHVTPEESEIDIIKELLEVQIDRMKLSFPSQYSSTYESVVNDDNLGIRDQMLEQRVVELENESEVFTMREVPEVQKENMEHQSTSQYISEIQKDNMEHQLISQYSSMNEKDGDEDNLRTRNQMLEVQNVELINELDALRRENQLLRSQLFSSQIFEGQIVELKKEVDDLRREKQLLNLSSNNLVDRLERIVFFEDINEREEL